MQLVLIALWTAVYPTLLAAVMILLSMPEPRRLLTAFLLAGFLISIGLGLAIVALLQGSTVVTSSRAGLGWGADLAVGSLFVMLAVALALRADRRFAERRRARRPLSDEEIEREPLAQRILARGSIPIVFTAGLVINLPGAAYLIGLKDIAAGDHPAGLVIFQVVLFNVIMFLIAEITLFYLVFKPQRVDAVVRLMDRTLSAYGRRIGTTVSATLGLFLIARGIVHS